MVSGTVKFLIFAGKNESERNVPNYSLLKTQKDRPRVFVPPVFLCPRKRTFTFTPCKNMSDKIIFRGLIYKHNAVIAFVYNHINEEDARRGLQKNDR